jgi:hypothetical protein
VVVVGASGTGEDGKEETQEEEEDVEGMGWRGTRRLGVGVQTLGQRSGGGRTGQSVEWIRSVRVRLCAHSAADFLRRR